MTWIIDHRRNSLQLLQETDSRFGIEIDLRSKNGQLILAHDPFLEGPLFEDWLKAYRHPLLVVNLKEAGLEPYVEDLLTRYAIPQWFYGDQSFLALLQMAQRGCRSGAIRVSEYESPKTALSLARRVDWVWVDCLTKMPLTRAQAELLRAAGFKLCFVSPELQGRPLEEAFMGQVFALGAPDAICTCTPLLWESALASMRFEGKTSAQLAKALLGKLSDPT